MILISFRKGSTMKVEQNHRKHSLLAVFEVETQWQDKSKT